MGSDYLLQVVCLQPYDLLVTESKWSLCGPKEKFNLLPRIVWQLFSPYGSVIKCFDDSFSCCVPKSQQHFAKTMGQL